MNKFNPETFRKLCFDNEFEEIKILLKENRDSKKVMNSMLTEGFQQLFYNGNLEVIKYFLTSKELAQHADIHYLNDVGLAIASMYNHLDVVKYLLTDSELKEHAHLQADNNRAFRWACEAGNVEIMNFLVHGQELKERANINDIDKHHCHAFLSACDQAKLKSLLFLIEQENFNLPLALSHINGDNKNAFILACENHEYDTDIIDFLLIECNYQLTDKDNQYIDEICQMPFHIKKDMALHAKEILNIRSSYSHIQKSLKNELLKMNKRKI